ncbi:MAG TPA: glycerol-3-phosphate dehydrogenase/oxidase [Candidatus Binatia bacterium]|jgi:glycerol-3-phosphate dehydrogenase|nr:glycerol-3-phosphate dehydrogenase/oxidase [Candidatus Binatia bacterium]
MRREDMLQRLGEPGAWDVVVVGGGASGLGCAVDAAARGFRTLLLEQDDFAKATSSRSTKLVHGGVRYLEQGNIPLVMEALRERGLLHRNAPHLVRNLPFVVPRYKWWEGPFFGVGLKLYDLLAGRLNLARSRLLNREETIARIPNLERENLLGGVLYHDGQFDDARLAISLAQTAVDHGACVLNHVRVTGLVKRDGMIVGVHAADQETGTAYEVEARVVVNATGIFADGIRRLDDPATAPIVQPSQGVHLVVDRSFLAGDAAIMVPHTDDGRVLFVIPWHGRAVIGTTDTPMPEAQLEPRPLADEVRFILRNAARYLTHDPTEADVLCAFAGQRPLVQEPGAKSTKELSRGHLVLVSDAGLVTIVGGKWTTYRHMAQDTIDHAIAVGGLSERPCVTEAMPVHGARATEGLPDHLSCYGTDAPAVEALIASSPEMSALLDPRLPYAGGAVVWGVRHEMARTVEDVLSRRTRCLLLDARASIDAAPVVAALMAAELGRDGAWVTAQVDAYRALARGYLL